MLVRVRIGLRRRWEKEFISSEVLGMIVYTLLKRIDIELAMKLQMEKCGYAVSSIELLHLSYQSNPNDEFQARVVSVVREQDQLWDGK